MSSETLAFFSVMASVATAFGALMAAWQLYLVHKQGVTNFEDSFAKEYRDLAAKLPTKALLDKSLSDEEYAKHFDELYHYFDLCNHQVFLFKTGRISEKTWDFWRDGISSNMRRPTFKRAWSEISSRANGDFSELRALYPV